MDRGYPPSKWDEPEDTSSQKAADKKTSSRSLLESREETTHDSTLSSQAGRDIRSATYGTLLSALHSSPLPSSSNSFDNPRNNPFPSAQTNPKTQSNTESSKPKISAQSSTVPKAPPIFPASVLSADALKQQIMLAGIKALTMGNPTLQAQLLLGQSAPILGGNVKIPVPDGSGLLKYRAPDIQSFVFDQKAGYKFDKSTGLHYDANSGLFINLTSKTFLRWDPLLNTYLRVDIPGLGQPVGVAAPRTSAAVFSPLSDISVVGSLLQPGQLAQAGSQVGVNRPSSNLGFPNVAVSGPQDSFMNEIWQRMRVLAKEVIGDTLTSSENPVKRNESSSSDESDGHGREKGKRSSRSRSRSSSRGAISEEHSKRHKRSRTSTELKNKSKKKKAKKRKGSRGRDLKRSHSTERRSISTSRRLKRSHSRSLSRGREQRNSRSAERRSISTSRRRINSQSRSMSRGRKLRKSRSAERRSIRTSRRRTKSQSRSLSRGKKLRRSRSTERSSIRTIQRRKKSQSRSLSRGRELRSWSSEKRSRSTSRRRRRRSISRPRGSRNRLRSSSRDSRRSRSIGPRKRRSISSYGRRRRSRSRARRSHSRSQSRVRRSRSRSYSRVRTNRSRSVSRSPVYKRRPRDAEPQYRRSKRIRSHSGSESPLQIEDGRHNRWKQRRTTEFRTTEEEEAKIENEENRVDSEDLSEFDFLKETLDDDNDSIIIDDCEETLERDESVFERKEITDVGDIFGSLFSNDCNNFTKIIVVAPVPLQDDGKNAKFLKIQIGNSEDLEKVLVYHMNAIGAPCHLAYVIHKTTEAALNWFESSQGVAVLTDGHGGSMKGYLHLVESSAWHCKNCCSFNFNLRTLCHKCYQPENRGYSPVTVASDPTKFVAISKLKSCYQSIQSVWDFIPSRGNFLIKSVKMLTDLGRMPLGLCVFEMEGEEEGKKFYEFLRKKGRSSMYVSLNSSGEISGKTYHLEDFVCESKRIEQLNVMVVSDFITNPENYELTSKCAETTVCATGVADGAGDLTETSDVETVKDPLALLFVGETQKSYIMVAPIPLSKIPKKTKSELSLIESSLEKALTDDEYSCIALFTDKNVGAPCCYGIITFPNAAKAADFHSKHKNSLTLYIEGLEAPKPAKTKFKVFLHFSEDNWTCQNCHNANFPLRTLCHQCFSHKDVNVSGPVKKSTSTTRWVATSKLNDWFSGDCRILADFRDRMKDLKLSKIDVLRDPKFPVLPQACVFETESWGESLRLREFLLRTGRFSHFVITRECFNEYACTRTQPAMIEPAAEVVSNPSHPGSTELAAEQSAAATESASATAFQACNEIDFDADAEVPIPKNYVQASLIWWNSDSPTFSTVLNDLFVNNPATKIPPGKTIFVGPLSSGFSCNEAHASTLKTTLSDILEQDNFQFTDISISHPSVVGAPCIYAMVTLKTLQAAEAWQDKHKNGLILPNKEPTRKSDLAVAFHKTFLFFCNPDWMCRKCGKMNFGLRSHCHQCYNSKDHNEPIITFSDIPTNLLCIPNYKHWCATEKILSSKSFLEGQKFTVNYVKDDCGMPLGICMLKADDIDGAMTLYRRINQNFRKSGVKYGILLQRIEANVRTVSKDNPGLHAPSTVGNTVDHKDLGVTSTSANDAYPRLQASLSNNRSSSHQVVGQDEFSVMFSDRKNRGKTKILYVSPIPTHSSAASFYNALTPAEQANVVKVELCLADKVGAPRDYFLIHFSSSGWATCFYLMHEGRMILEHKGPDDSEASPVVAFIHFAENQSWSCSCGSENFFLRSICFNCFKHKLAACAPFSQVATPSKWLAIRTFQSIYPNTKYFGLEQSQYNAFKVKQVTVISDNKIPRDKYLVYIVETQSAEEAKCLECFLQSSPNKISADYVSLNFREFKDFRGGKKFLLPTKRSRKLARRKAGTSSYLTPVSTSADPLKNSLVSTEADASGPPGSISALLQPENASVCATARVSTLLPDYDTILWLAFHGSLLDKPSSNVIMISLCPGDRELPDGARTQVQNSLKQASLDYESIVFCSKIDVGSPFSYCLVSFDAVESAKAWMDKCNGTFTFNVPSPADETYPVNLQNCFSANPASTEKDRYFIRSKLHYSSPNWQCSCGVSNFFLRSLCHTCFKNKHLKSAYVAASEPTVFIGIKLSGYKQITVNVQKILGRLGHSMINFSVCYDPALPRDPCGLVILKADDLKRSSELYDFLVHMKSDPEKLLLEELSFALENSPGIIYLDCCKFERQRSFILESVHWDSYFTDATPTSIIIGNTGRPNYLKPLLEGNDKLGVVNERIYKGEGGLIPHFWMVRFLSPENAKEWYDLMEGKVKNYGKIRNLHFSQDLWFCSGCFAQNFPARVLCHSCYQHKTKGFRQLYVTNIPTCFVGVLKEREQRLVMAAVHNRQRKKAEVFFVKGYQFYFDPVVMEDGNCILLLEAASVADAITLKAFCRRIGANVPFFNRFDHPETDITSNARPHLSPDVIPKVEHSETLNDETPTDPSNKNVLESKASPLSASQTVDDRASMDSSDFSASPKDVPIFPDENIRKPYSEMSCADKGSSENSGDKESGNQPSPEPAAAGSPDHMETSEPESVLKSEHLATLQMPTTSEVVGSLAPIETINANSIQEGEHEQPHALSSAQSSDSPVPVESSESKPLQKCEPSAEPLAGSLQFSEDITRKPGEEEPQMTADP